uniref:proline-rich protein 18 n=1 Tax=Nyctereutes procyonoides TaxID=34880 RepID=UPI00244495A2|nr:proline-rich protein 18 [Nyctereutes procyonoides]
MKTGPEAGGGRREAGRVRGRPAPPRAVGLRVWSQQQPPRHPPGHPRPRAPPPAGASRSARGSLGRPPARRAPPGSAGAPAPAALRLPLSLTPEAVLLLQGRHLQKPLLAPPAPRRPQAPPPRAALPVSLHRYDDVEDEDEAAPPRDDGLVRRCTEWLRGVEAAARARDRAGPLDALPHLSTL